jgi:uncharacterized membrane protein
MSHTVQGWAHVVAAVLALLLGAPQVARRPGDRWHRRVGYAYLLALGCCDLAAFAVYHFTGHFNVLHVGALVSAYCLVCGTLPLYRQPRALEAKIQHARWMLRSYVGVWAAGLTELVVRTVRWTSRTDIVVATVAITMVVTVAGRLAGRRVTTQARALGPLSEQPGT